MQVCLEGKKVERDHEHEAKAPGNREAARHGTWAHPGEQQDEERSDQSDLRRIVLRDRDRHGQRKEEQHAEEHAAGTWQRPERQESGPEQQRQYGDILVELRKVDLGDPVVTDGHVLGALGPERGEGVHGRAGDRPVGEKLDGDEASGAKRAGDKSLRRAANLIGIEGGNCRRRGKHHERGSEEKRALGESGLRISRPDRAQACIGRDRDESDQSGVRLE